ncbi:progestin and adipoQ receptor family member 3-like [Culicoides brevitarsis]|uniref:progestin and adipoQ receptor family member 3-like n=1 Tax=Culicoides brevitarsis TaxID=469753 RepID=UPI00307BF506
MTYLSAHADLTDIIIIGCLLTSFELCLVCSTVYHTFCCRSSKIYDCLLTFDLLGIGIALFCIFASGIYYAFYTQTETRNFYLTSVAVIFMIAMILQIPKLGVPNNVKMLSLLLWAVYGVVPSCHWFFKMGGFSNKMVEIFIPRIIGAYAIAGFAFLFYASRIPERWFAGKVDFLGHSHNLWHILVLVALNYWHNTGIMLAVFMMDNGCIDDREKCYLIQNI